VVGSRRRKKAATFDAPHSLRPAFAQGLNYSANAANPAAKHPPRAADRAREVGNEGHPDALHFSPRPPSRIKTTAAEHDDEAGTRQRRRPPNNFGGLHTKRLLMCLKSSPQPVTSAATSPASASSGATSANVSSSSPSSWRRRVTVPSDWKM